MYLRYIIRCYKGCGFQGKPSCLGVLLCQRRSWGPARETMMTAAVLTALLEKE